MYLEWNIFTVIYDSDIFPYLCPFPSLLNQVTNYPVMSKKIPEIHLLSFKRGMFVLYAKYSKKPFLLLFKETLKTICFNPDPTIKCYDPNSWPLGN